jgi:hypothetical protein
MFRLRVPAYESPPTSLRLRVPAYESPPTSPRLRVPASESPPPSPRLRVPGYSPPRLKSPARVPGYESPPPSPRLRVPASTLSPRLRVTSPRLQQSPPPGVHGSSLLVLLHIEILLKYSCIVYSFIVSQHIVFGSL